MKHLVLLTGCAVFVAACSGNDGPANPNPTSPLVETIDQSPQAATFSIEETIPLADSIAAIGATTGGHPVLAAAGKVYELEAASLQWRPLYDEGGEDPTLGTVGAIRPRVEGGAWLAGDDRLFIVDELFVLTSPLMLDAGAIHDVADVGSGALAGLWLAAEQGLYRRTADAIEKWSIPNLDGAATGIAVSTNGRFAAAIVGAELVVLEDDAGQVVSDRGVVDIGTVTSVAASQNAVWAAGAKGVVRYSPDEAPPYRMYAVTGAERVVTDPVTGAAWVRTADGIIEIEGKSLASYAMPMIAGQTPDLVVDRLGDVFSAGAEGLAKNGTGAAGAGATFSADVLPWIQSNCSQCHMNQTQNFETFEVFAELAEDALSRVRTGDMPRCTGGVRCPDEQRLAPADYAVLEQWLRDGKVE
jgi:hypothetical protein